jgi:hypothetical protein
MTHIRYLILLSFAFVVSGDFAARCNLLLPGIDAIEDPVAILRQYLPVLLCSPIPIWRRLSHGETEKI